MYVCGILRSHAKRIIPHIRSLSPSQMAESCSLLLCSRRVSSRRLPKAARRGFSSRNGATCMFLMRSAEQCASSQAEMQTSSQRIVRRLLFASCSSFRVGQIISLRGKRDSCRPRLVQERGISGERGDAAVGIGPISAPVTESSSSS